MASPRFCALAILALFASPLSLAQPAGSLTVGTDRQSYSPSGIVTVSFSNLGPTAVYVLSRGCNAYDPAPLPAFVLERREGTGWVPAVLNYGCPAVYVPPTEVGLEESYDVRFRVGVLADLSPGTYRYVFYVVGEDRRSLLPEPERTSGAFVVN